MNNISKIMLLISCIILTTACVSKSIGTGNTVSSNTVTDKVAIEETSPYSYDKDYYFAKIKLAPFDPNASQLISEVSGKFYFKNDCLVFISDYGDVTTPILPAGVTDWDEDSQTLTIVGKSIKMGQQVSTNGSFREIREKRKGVCWQDLVAGIGTMGLEVGE